MGRLISAGIVSLDGYVNDSDGTFAWAAPAEDVHAFINEGQRSIGTYLYGRRMYETMSAWEDDSWLAGAPAAIADFAPVWRAADKIVYSTTLTEPWTARTRMERGFDPDQVRRLKDSSETDLAVAGPTLAAQALRAGLVDEVQLFVVPVVVGGGTAFFPPDMRLDLDLIEERAFSSGVVHLRHRVQG